MDIYDHIAETDSPAKAANLLDSLQDICGKLAELPERGNVPKELAEIGVTDYRELHYKPYRVIYRISGDRVIVYCVLDGRRDMASLLERRLLR